MVLNVHLFAPITANSPANGHHSSAPRSTPVHEDDGWTQVPPKKGKAPIGKPQSAPVSTPMQTQPGSTSAANLTTTDHPPADLHTTLQPEARDSDLRPFTDTETSLPSAPSSVEPSRSARERTLRSFF
ncbi:hypothetical protein NL676_010912 [Syzygium grande]|nr:hypothetical protein NL676_010912 [Syzygium grande]